MSDAQVQTPAFDMPLQGFDVRGAWVIKHLIVDLDLTAEQAAGIVGNLGGESGLTAIQERNPIAGRGGFGWAQWTGPRRVAFEHWCADHDLSVTSDEANYNFLLEELRGEQAHSLEQLKKTTAIDSAVYTFEVYFERPSDPEGGLPARVAFAKRALAALSEPANLRPPPRPAPAQPVRRYPVPMPWQPPQEPAVTIMPPPLPPQVPMTAFQGSGVALGASGIAGFLVYTLYLALDAFGYHPPMQWFVGLDGLLLSFFAYVAHDQIIQAARAKIIRDLQ